MTTQIEGAEQSTPWWKQFGDAFGEGIIDVMRDGFDSIDFGDDEPPAENPAGYGSPSHQPYTPYPSPDMGTDYYEQLKSNPLLLAAAVILGGLIIVKLAK